MNCSNTAHTCGACLSSEYIGVAGSSNTRCIFSGGDGGGAADDMTTDNDATDNVSSNYTSTNVTDNVVDIGNNTASTNATANGTITYNNTMAHNATSDTFANNTAANTTTFANNTAANTTAPANNTVPDDDATDDTASDPLCYDDSMCAEFLVCSSKLVCVPVPKAGCDSTVCPPAQGDCGYLIDASGVRVDSCYVGDQACSAACHCHDGWSGVSCAVSYAELEQSTALVTEALCALAEQAREKRDSEGVAAADLTSWTNQLKFLSLESSSLRLSVASALCTISVLDIILDSAVDANVTLQHMQVVLNTLDALLYIEQYFDYPELSSSPRPQARLWSGNLSSVLQHHCHVAHWLSPAQIPALSSQANLRFQVENNLTSPSHLDRCHMLGTESFGDAPLSSDFCVASCLPVLFEPNLTTMLDAELLTVTPPSMGVASLVISVACPPPPPLPPPPLQVTCDLNEIGWKDLSCLDDAGNNATVGFSCTGLVSFNASCQDVNVSHFNCSYVYCSGLYGMERMTCSCALAETEHTVDVSFTAVLASIALDFQGTLRSAGERPDREMWKTVVVLLCVLALFAFSLLVAERVDKSQAIKVANQAKAVDKREWNEVATATTSEQRKTALSAAMIQRTISSFPAIFNRDSMSDIFLMELMKSHRWASLLFHYSPRRPRALRLLVATTLVTCVLFLNALMFNVTHYDQDHSCKQHRYQHKCTAEPSLFSRHQSKCYWAEKDFLCHYKAPGSHSSAAVMAMLAAALCSIPVVLALELVVDRVLIRPSSALASSSASVSPSPMQDWDQGDDDGVSGHDGERDDTRVVKGARHDFVELASALILYRSSLQLEALRRFDRQWGFASPVGDLAAPVRLDLDRYLMELKRRNGEGIFMTDFDDVESGNMGVMAAVDKKLADGNQRVIFDRILQEITLARLHASREVCLMRSLSESERKSRLLFLFQKDLLVGIKGDIVARMAAEDDNLLIRDRQTRPVKAWVKVACLSSVVAVNIFFLVFVFLFCMNQDATRQAAFLQSFAIWLTVEVVLVSTACMIVTRIVLPLAFLQRAVATTKRQMHKAIQTFFDCNGASRSKSVQPEIISVARSRHMSLSATEVRQEPAAPLPLNICPFLFVSHRVAIEFPELAESDVVLGFRASRPKAAFSSGSVVPSPQQRSHFAALASLNSVNIFILVFASSIIDSSLGYQVVSIVNWLLFGYIMGFDHNTLVNVNSGEGLAFVVVFWATVLYLLQDMIKKVNLTLGERNDTSTARQENVTRRKNVNIQSREEIEKVVVKVKENKELYEKALALKPRGGNADQDDADDRSNSDDSDGSDDTAELVEGVVSILTRQLQQIDDQLTEALVAEEFAQLEGSDGNSNTSRDFSDEYKMLYDPVMRPFVDSTGQQVTTMMIFHRRRLAAASDPEGYRRRTELVERIENSFVEWDHFRMFDSEKVLPFIDRCGQRIDEAAIREQRSRVTPRLHPRRSNSSLRVRELRESKQAAEYRLLVCTERMTEEDVNDVTGSMTTRGQSRGWSRGWRRRQLHVEQKTTQSPVAPRRVGLGS